MNQLRTGAALSYLTIIITNLVGLLLTPYIIRMLQADEYGLYTLIGSFVGYLTLLDFGLNNTIVRFVAKYRAEGDAKGEAEFLGMSLIFYVVISTILVCIGIVFYYNLEWIFSKSMDPEQIDKAKIMVLILVFNLAVTLPGNSFQAISSGYEKFIFPRAASIIKYLIRSVTVVVILYYGAKAVEIVILDTVMNLLLIISNGFYVFKILKVKVSFKQIQKPMLYTVFSYSIWIFVFALVRQFQWKGGQMVLGIMTDTTTVAILAVGIMLGSYYGAFSSAITSVFLPRATKMAVDNASGEELTSMMIRIGRLSFFVLLYIFGAFLLYGKQFVLLWVGDEFTEAWQIALLIMIAYTVPLVQGFGNSILEAKAKLRFKAIIYVSFVVIGVLLGALLVPKYGATGMVAGNVIGWMISQNIMNFYYHKAIRINIIRFFKELVDKNLLSMAFIMLVGVGITMLPGDGWMIFILKSALYSLTYFAVMYRFGMHVYEVDLIKSVIKRKR
ncbi:lipopolysaccharide biosynthesis protein [Carboxylicivirga sp. RSCT41]|uniref:lipopolysaccharide biosynthesis protein n=1 Tax=Carboxylicivirga agarovorans TaxID=3417570 RepID=UPI003D34043D